MMAGRVWSAAACVACAAITGAALAYGAAPWGSNWARPAASAVMGGFLAAAFALGRGVIFDLPRGRRVAAASALCLTAVAGMGGTAAALLEPARQQALDAGFREIERQVPAFATLRASDSAAYARFRDRIGAVLARGGTRDDAAREARPILTQAFAARVVGAEDGLLVRMLETTLEQAEELRPQRPDLCAALLLGRPSGSFAPYLSTAAARAELALMEELLRAPPLSAPPAVATAAEASAVLGAALQEASGEIGIAPERLLALAQGSGPDAEVCGGLIAWMRALRAMPAPVAMPAYRYLFQEARRGI